MMLYSLLNKFVHKMGIDVKRFVPRRKFPQGRIWYQEKYIDFGIKLDDLVLDVGCDGHPFPYATVYCDQRYQKNNTLPISDLYLDRKPFVLADINNLPFADKRFDFVYCSHVLEHVDDPICACNELMRVGRRGYIETPNFMKDCLFSWAKGMHRWHTVAIGNTLLFFEYSPRETEGIRSHAWETTIMSQDEYHPLQDAFWDNQDVFNTRLLWKDSFEVRVFRQPKMGVSHE